MQNTETVSKDPVVYTKVISFDRLLTHHPSTQLLSC
jgi:hypothetical protein